MKIKNLKKRYMTLLELLIGMALTMLLLTTLTFFYQEIDQLNSASERMQKETFQLQFLENRLNTVLPKILSGSGKKPPIFFSSHDLNGLLAPGNPSLVFSYETGTDLDDKRAVTALGRIFLDKDHRLCLATWPDPEEWKESQVPTGHLEVLIENVDAVGFSFYVTPERDRSLVETKHKKLEDAQKPEATHPKKPEKKPEANKKELKIKKDDVKEKEKEDKENEAPKELEELNANVDMNEIEPEPKGHWVSEWKREYKQIPAMMKVKILQYAHDEEKITIFAFPLLKSKNVIVYE